MTTLVIPPMPNMAEGIFVAEQLYLQAKRPRSYPTLAVYHAIDVYTQSSTQ